MHDSAKQNIAVVEIVRNLFEIFTKMIIIMDTIELVMSDEISQFDRNL